MATSKEVVPRSVSQFTSIAADALNRCKDAVLCEAIAAVRDPLARVAASGNHDGKRHARERRLFFAATELYDAYLNAYLNATVGRPEWHPFARLPSTETNIVRRGLEVVLSELQSPPYRESLSSRLGNLL